MPGWPLVAVAAAVATAVSATAAGPAVTSAGGSHAPIGRAAVGDGPLPPLLAPPGTPEQDPFYRPPADLDRYDNGEVIRTREARALLDPRRLPATRAWQLLYRSTTATGDPDAVSGTLLVPDAPWLGPGPRPLVTFDYGSQGFADRCAPSYQLAEGTELEPAVYQAGLRQGWAVVSTDEEGLGPPGPHTIFVQRSEGHAVLDAARAAPQVPGAGVAPGAPVGIWGYSQGGGATGMAAEQAADYAPELHYVGVAEGGVVADVRAVTRHFFDLPTHRSIAVAIIGAFRDAYPDTDLDRRFTPTGHRVLDQVRGQCISESLTSGLTDPPPARGFVGDVLDYPPLVERMRQDSLGQHTPTMPVLIYHARTDEFVPWDQSHALYRYYCAHGARAGMFSPPGEHLSGVAALAPAAVAFLADRFAGAPYTGGCPPG